jgi:hypothetical protein
MLEVILDSTIEDSIFFERFGAEEKGLILSGGACIIERGRFLMFWKVNFSLPHLCSCKAASLIVFMTAL